MRVLYVNHTAVMSGGERSLLDLLGALPESVEATLAAPAGTLQLAARDLGVPVSEIRGTAGSLRLHPLHTPRALGEMAIAALGVRRATARTDAQLVHANSIRAGILSGLGGRRGLPAVVHVRDCLPPGALTSATMRLIASTATTIVANSHYTARSVQAAAQGARVEVVYNGVDPARLDPRRFDRAAVRARLPGAGAEPLLGVVAQLTPWKGQDTAIRALALLREEGVEARLLLIGSASFISPATRFDNEAYVRGLETLAHELGVAERVSWLGQREDVAELVAALDMLLLPSWEEPFGRAVIEAMALEVPVLATNVGGPAEILAGGGGVLLAPHEPLAWARAAAELAGDAALRGELGRAGRERVEQAFTLRAHAAAMLGLYERAIAVG